jgi:hypothetical protein
MNFVLPQLLERIFEDAGSGKIVSVVGVGLLLALAIGFRTSTEFGISLMPIDTAALTWERGSEALRHREALTCFVRAETAASAAHDTDCNALIPWEPPEPIDGQESDDLESECAATTKPTRRTVVDILRDPPLVPDAEHDGTARALQARITLLDRCLAPATGRKERLSAALDAASGAARDLLRPQLDELDGRIRFLEKQRTVTASLKEVYESYGETLRTITDEVRNAAELKANLDRLGAHVGALIVLSVLLGVITAQIARLALYLTDWIHDVRAPRSDPERDGTERPDPAAVPERGRSGDGSSILPSEERSRRIVQLSPEQKLERQRLISTKLRYAESSLNLVLPVLALGWAGAEYVETWRIAADGSPLRIAGTGIALLLAWSAILTYRSFRRKDSELLRGAFTPVIPLREPGKVDPSRGADGTRNAPNT